MNLFPCLVSLHPAVGVSLPPRNPLVEHQLVTIVSSKVLPTLRTSGRRWWRRFGCIRPLADVRVCLLAVRLEPLHLLVVQRRAGLRVEAGVEPVGVLHRPPVRPSPNVVSFGQPEPEFR